MLLRSPSIAAVDHGANGVRAADAFDGKAQKAVAEQNFIAWDEVLHEPFVADGNAVFVANDFIGCERELVAFAQRDAAVLEGADAVLRPFRIQHDGDGQVQLLAQALDRFNPGEVFGMVTVRKIEPGYVHARKEHLAQRALRFRTRGRWVQMIFVLH